MKALLRAGAGAVAGALAACGGGDGPNLFEPPPPPVALARVSGLTPFQSGCDQQTAAGTNYRSSEVEPYLAINPTDADNFVGTWQQDRWSNGGARGLLAGVSFDGGQTWEARTAPFSRCTGGNSINDGDYARATDPWITFGPDGNAYWMAMTITDSASASASAMRVSRSTDGGDTWEAPITLIHSVDPYFNDKNSMTADPTDANYIYATWDRLDANLNGGPAWFARSSDNGVSWEPAQLIYDPGSGAQTVGNLVAVLPDGTLLLLVTEIHFASAQPDGAFLRVLRSTDHGDTWEAPVTIAEMLTVGTTDPDSGQAVRSGGILGSISVAPNGDAWVAWQDSRPLCALCAPTLDRIVIAQSTDGGLTWGDPQLVSPEPQVQAFTASVHVAADGTLGVTYYDLRDDVLGDGYLLTSYWLATSTDGVDWTERLISGPFDLGIAPDALGLFVGDYEGLSSSGTDFVPFFAQTVPSLRNRTDIFAVRLPTVAPASALAKAGVARYRAQALPPVTMTPEWRARIDRNIEIKRQHFPDRWRPGQLPKYLRRLG